ncbi:MAG: phosphoenolpyruvate carboxylase [Thermoleophilia bacterium]
MSTQHPDNVNVPFFSSGPELSGEDEVQEAYYAFSHLGCDEQMWDVEGKEVDSFVVKKLLTHHEPYFTDNRLGRDLFLTLRVPNPTVERTEAKILLETLESIPRSFDASRHVFGDDLAPIFEVILPMTTSAKCVDRVYHYYRDFIVGRQHKAFFDGDISIAEWIGEFKPDLINVIPLFEDLPHLAAADTITEAYVSNKGVTHQRVFLARSDPALNYGIVSAVLATKIALARLERLAQRTGVAIHPILGAGSAPFRGNLSPINAPRVAQEYPSVETFTVQSAFKYDHAPTEVMNAIRYLRDRATRPAHEIDEAAALDLTERYSAEYQRQVQDLAPIINSVARFVPSRRKRKLHVGLFGYSRRLGDVQLPRAIAFTAALYSIGVPPELLGLSALTTEDLAFLRSTYRHFDSDLKDAMRYADVESPHMPRAVVRALRKLGIAAVQDEEHLDLTRQITALVTRERAESVPDLVVRAAIQRRFLG